MGSRKVGQVCNSYSAQTSSIAVMVQPPANVPATKVEADVSWTPVLNIDPIDSTPMILL